MNKLEFNRLIKEFVHLDFSKQEDVLRVELTIEFFRGDVGEGIRFSGRFILEQDRSLPIDLRKVSKMKYKELIDSSKLYYNQYLLESKNPCNIIKIIILKGGDDIQYFHCWDSVVE